MLPINNTSLVSALPELSSTVKDNYLDQNSLNAVKLMGHHDDPAALKEIAKKFESMFVQQMLKSMRDANEVFADGDLFSSEEVKFHQQMLDQQMVLNLTSGQGIGMAKAMFEQMEKVYGKSEKDKNYPVRAKDKTLLQTPTLKPLHMTSNVPPEIMSRSGVKSSVAQTQDEFVAKVKPYAEKAAAELNVSPDVLIAQAALETGWGKHLIHDGEGNNTFNIFNIKASGAWTGKSVVVNTLENKQGIAQQERSEFRQYTNYAQSFADYVSLIKHNPRYEKALSAGVNSSQYADALQQAGYATDPEYAAKIKRIIASDPIRNAKSILPEYAEIDSTSIKSVGNGVQS